MKHPCPQLKLMSFHIPKTGGTSFRNTLKGVYGDDQVARVDAENRTSLQVNGQVIPEGSAIEFEVIHGHIFWSNWEKMFAAPEGIQKVIWLRDPVERVASQYHYLVEVLKRELDEEGKGLNILSKLMKTFPEFIRNKKVQNILTRYVTPDIIEEQFDFVGILEHRQEDLATLAAKLNWSEFEDFEHNKTAERPDPTPAERDLIRAYNQADVHLYEQALEWREQGRFS